MYSEADLSGEQIVSLHQEGLRHNLFIEFFGPAYAKVRSEMGMDKPLAFISHDSRDKADIARPLAIKLSVLGTPVWFDEFSLKVGDSLRESIEKGIKTAPYCILILTKHFLGNTGWSKTEFNSVFTKEMIINTQVIVPVWSGVTKE